MDKFFIKDMKRTPGLFKTYLREENNKTFTEKDFSILFPSFYVNRNLAKIESKVELLLIVMFLDPETNQYSTLSLPIKQFFVPESVYQVQLNGADYYKMDFKAGEIVTPNNECVQSSDFIFDIFELFFILGKIPVYLDYVECGDLLAQAKKYAGSAAGDNVIAMHIITAVISRVLGDENKLYKEVIEKPSDINKYKISYKGLNDPFYGVDSTANAIIGGHLTDNIIGSVMVPEKESSKIANILKA